MAKKSIVEEALLEAKQLEEALKKNSKEILAATMKQDIDEIVKASLNEDETAKEDEELENESQMEASEDESSTMVMDEQSEESEEESDEMGEESEEESEDSVETDSDEMGEEDTDMEMDFDTEEPSSEEVEDTDVIDMTGASEEELISVFKKMSDNDEIEVVKTGNNVNLKDKKTGAEYMIKMDESMSYEDEDEVISYDEMMDSHEDEDEVMSYDEMMDSDEMYHGNEDEGKKKSYDDIKSMFRITSKDEAECDECGWEESEDEGQEPIYEITFEDDDEDDYDELLKDIKPVKKPKHVDSEDSEDEMDFDFEEEEDEDEDEDESFGGHDEGTRRTQADRRRIALHPQNYPSSRMDESVKSEYKKVIKEYNDLKDKYVQTKDALKVFRDKLGEIALFNSNLTHAVKLFMEHATTKTEKTVIMKRFDEEAVTLKESKRLYKTITNELKDRKPISEKVEKKINESLTKGSSDTLIESKVYIDPQISKIHSLMDKLDNRK